MRAMNIVFGLCCLCIYTSSYAHDNLNPSVADPSRARVLPLTSQRFQGGGFPQAVRQGYDYLDSICRSAEVFRFDEMIRLTGSYGALRPYLSTMYYLSDYDPLLYLQHSQYAPATCAHAYFAPERVQYDVFARLVSLRAPEARRIESLVSAAGIYTIRITNVENDTLKVFDDSGKAICAGVRTTVTGQVIDTIKGKHWLPGKTSPIASANNGADEIRFSFDARGMCRKGPARAPSAELTAYGAQMNNTLPLTYGDYDWSAGSEYVVFLQFGGYGNDGAYDYFGVVPQSQYDDQGGIYPIKNGNVSDASNFWGAGASVSLADFRYGLHRMISNILYGEEGIYGAIGQR